MAVRIERQHIDRAEEWIAETGSSQTVDEVARELAELDESNDVDDAERASRAPLNCNHVSRWSP